MQDSSLSLSLAKVVAVAAWAEGEVVPEERDCLMDLLYQLPGLSLKDWRTVQKLLEHPISPACRTRYLNQLIDSINTEQAKILALYALERMAEADGVIAESEQILIDQFIECVEAFPMDALTLLLQILKPPLRRRRLAANCTEKEFAPIDDVIAARVDNWIAGGFALGSRTREDLRRLCLAGILLARVIQADDHIDERELATAIDFLIANWKLEREQAEFVMIVSLSDAFSRLDALRVSRWLFEETNLWERRGFLELLFEIAVIDGELHEHELDEIMHICANLRLDHLDFQRHYERVCEMAG